MILKSDVALEASVIVRGRGTRIPQLRMQRAMQLQHASLRPFNAAMRNWRSNMVVWRRTGLVVRDRTGTHHAEDVGKFPLAPSHDPAIDDGPVITPSALA